MKQQPLLAVGDGFGGLFNELLLLYRYPLRSAPALLGGALPRRYCAASFASKIPTWRLPTEGRPQERVQRHARSTSSSWLSMLLCGRWWTSWWTSSSSLTRFCTLPSSQVIEVPKDILEDRIPPRTPLREPQLVEQLVEVSTVPCFVEQTVDIPVLADLQGFFPEQSSTAHAWLDGGGLQGFLPKTGFSSICGGLHGLPPGQVSTASSSVHRSSTAALNTADEPFDGVCRTFPRPQKIARVAAHSSAELGAHSSPSTLSAHQMAPHEGDAAHSMELGSIFSSDLVIASIISLRRNIESPLGLVDLP